MAYKWLKRGLKSDPEFVGTPCKREQKIYFWRENSKELIYFLVIFSLSKLSFKNCSSVDYNQNSPLKRILIYLCGSCKLDSSSLNCRRPYKRILLMRNLNTWLNVGRVSLKMYSSIFGHFVLVTLDTI